MSQTFAEAFDALAVRIHNVCDAETRALLYAAHQARQRERTPSKLKPTGDAQRDRLIAARLGVRRHDGPSL